MTQTAAYVTAEILANGDLKIVASQECLRDLKERMASDPDSFDSDQLTHEVLSPLVENDEYEWTEPHYCGALTSAPMLAVYDVETPLPDGADPSYHRIAGHWEGKTWYTPVLKCWAFMSYAVTSPQRTLLENGHCIFQGGQEA